MLQNLRKLPRAMGRCAVIALGALALGVITVLDKAMNTFFISACAVAAAWCVLNVLGSPW